MNWIYRDEFKCLIVVIISLIFVRILTVTELFYSSFFLTQNFFILYIISILIDIYLFKYKKKDTVKFLSFFLIFLSLRALFHSPYDSISYVFVGAMSITTVIYFFKKTALATFLTSFWLTYNYDSSFIGLLDVLSHNVISYLFLFSFLLIAIFESLGYHIKSKNSIIFVLLASSYFSAFLAKFYMNNTWVNYLVHNDMSNLITASVINRSNILPVYVLKYLEPYIDFLKYLSLLAEGLWIVIFWMSFNLRMLLLIITLGMHVMIYLTTGILFSQWIFLLLLLILFVPKVKFNLSYKLGAVVSIFVLSFSKISPGPYLGWLDSKCIVSYDFISNSGRINRNVFKPFNLPITQNRLQKFFNDERLNLRSTYGSVNGLEQLSKFNNQCEKDLYKDFSNPFYKQRYRQIFFQNIKQKALKKKQAFTPSHITDNEPNMNLVLPLILIKEKYYIHGYLDYELLKRDTIQKIKT